MKILALIPARGGSKGVPNKNIKDLGGFPLISYTITSAIESKMINRVIVSTDYKEIADISKKYGAEVPFLRPARISSDKSTDIEFVTHSLDYLEEKEKYIPDVIVLLRPTTPLREVNYIDDAIKKLLNSNMATSLRSSHLVSESPYKWFLMEDGLYTPICDKYTLDDTNKPRQFFPEVYIPNGYVDIFKTDLIKKSNSLFGENILGYITPIGHEIDTIDDFEYLEYQVSKKSLKLVDNLKKIKEQI